MCFYVLNNSKIFMLYILTQKSEEQLANCNTFKSSSSAPATPKTGRNASLFTVKWCDNLKKYTYTTTNGV